MPKKAKELSALEVKRLKHPGGVGNVNFPVGGEVAGDFGFRLRPRTQSHGF